MSEYRQTLSSSVLAKQLAARMPEGEIREAALYREIAQLPGGSILRHVLEQLVYSAKATTNKGVCNV